jgi:predicted GIY-YIG superfamily endonuclease
MLLYMAPGKSIRLFLIDGTPTGMLAAEIVNWTGKVVVFAREKLAELAKREEAHRTGLYVLAGPDPNDPTHQWFYIGEGDDVLQRLAIHAREGKKEFWERTAIVVSKDANLTKAHARYLESRIIQMARTAKRARIVNETSPPLPALPEPDVADMEYFLEQVEMMFPVLGFSFLQAAPQFEATAAAKSESPLFHIASGNAKAEARVIDGQVVVLKGSTARKQGVESWSSYRSLRSDLVESGRLVDASDPQLLVFAENVAFDSPSGAAAVVLGRNVNGWLEWKMPETGMTYADWQALQLKIAGVDSAGEDETDASDE